MIMIVAADKNWGIGIKGGLLTNLPEDMKFFRETTKNSVVIMGRKTLESFPEKKPLKNRVNIVITKSGNISGEGVIIVSSVEEAAEKAKEYADKKVFVIGGGSVYKQMLKYCDTAYITKIDHVFENADTFIDNMDELDDWKIVEISDVKEYNGMKFNFVTYKRQ